MFAYIILAHHLPDHLALLLSLLDDARNDIYIHIDAKAGSFDRERVTKNISHSKIVFLPRMDLRWGDSSLHIGIMDALHYVVENGRYQYIHFLSGQDLPIRTQDEIHDFFAKNSGLEFVNMADDSKVYEDRIRYYHFFQKHIAKKTVSARTLNKVQLACLKLQKLLRVDRLKSTDFEIAKGSAWVSITQDFAEYCLSNRQWIEKICRHGTCCDELVFQMLLLKSPFRSKRYINPKNELLSHVRFIKWEKDAPNPLVLTMNHYDEMTNAGCFFARKFHPDVDAEVISKVAASLSGDSPK